MSRFKFSIPLQLNDLTSSSGHGEYRVENEYSARELKSKLNDVKLAIRQRGSEAILEGGFDIFYSVLTLFHKDLPTDMKYSSFELLSQALNDVIRLIDLFICSTDLSNETEKQIHVNRLKMTTYLYCQLVELLEADALQADTAIAASGKNKGRGKKKIDDDDETWNWDEKRQESVNLMFRLMNVNVHSLFDPPIAEEEFVNLVGNCMFRFLDNPAIALQRLRDVRISIIQVLGTLNSKYNYTLSCRLKLVQGLKIFEHLAVPTAEAIEKFTLEFNCRTFLIDVVREIDRVDSKEMSRDTSGTRAFSQLLVELAERLPEQMQPCLILLMKHLDGESYMLRKSILGIFGEIVLKLFRGGNLDENAKNSRDQYLDQLELHIHDVNAHVRSTALQVWGKLAQGNAIPLSRQHSILKLVVGRLQDKSSIVRKQAVQLLTLLLQCNPFDASLCVEGLKERFAEETKKYEEMLPIDDAQLSANKWNEVEKKLKEHFIADNVVEEEEEIEQIPESTDASEVHETIRRNLNELNIVKAVGLLEAAKKKFPIFKKLEQVDLNEEDEVEKEDEDDESDSENESVKSVINQMRKIFFLPLVVEGGEEDEGQITELAKQKKIVHFLRDAVEFASVFDQALPIVCMLLGSKLMTDVTEAINFFVSAYEFGLLNAMMGVRQMLALIFSRETSIQKSVVDAYKKLYINAVMPGNNANAVRTNNVQMVRNLMNLVSGTNVGDLAGLEELIGVLVTSKDIDKSCFQVMWQFFTKVISDQNDCSRSALVLLGMVATSEPSIITSNIHVLVEHGLGEEGRQNFRLVHDSCVALLKIASQKPAPGAVAFRLAEDHDLFVRLDELIYEGVDEMKDDAYVPMAQQAIAVIYQLSEAPDARMTGLIKRLSSKLEIAKDNPEINKEVLLSRFLFVLGHVAVCHLNYLDVAVLNELKRRSEIRENKKETDKKASKKKVTASASRKRRSVAETPKGQQSSEDVDDVVGAEADDADFEYIRSLTEKKVVTGQNLLALFAPLVEEVCRNPTNYTSHKLRASASLALAKFMLVSSEFCEDKLQVFFTLLEKSSEPSIRANLIIAAGDLSFRFTNALEPWTPNMYNCLRDKSSLVRSNTLTVLTHLILNDMIKVKGQISDMALCITDEESKISSLAKLFFSELSRKGNNLYNLMPDIVSRLSSPDAEIEEERFREIMKFIIELIEKDKHLETLVEKLCQRFRITKTERQWRDLAFCLSLFSYNDKALKKLMENFTCYSDKLHENSVYEAFANIIVMAKKTFKQDTKTIIEELSKKIEEEREKMVEDDTATKRAAAAKKEATKKKTNTRGKSRKVESSESEAEASEKSEDEQEEEKENIAVKNASGKAEKKAEKEKRPEPKSTRPARKRVVARLDSSSDDEDFAPTQRKKDTSKGPPSTPSPAKPTPSKNLPSRSTRRKR